MLIVELTVLFLLTAFNGFLAMAEISIISSRESLLEFLAAQGNRGARRALRLHADPSRFLSSVQIGITLIGVVAGAFSGMTLGTRLGKALDTIPLFHPHGEMIGIGLTVTLITIFSLIFGELVPKRIAMVHPERVAAVVATPMTVVSASTSPVVVLLRGATEAILRFLHVPRHRPSTVSEEEIKSLVAEGAESGVIAPVEREMIEGILRLADRPVRIIMTPRLKVNWIDLHADAEEIGGAVGTQRHSRLLVCDGTVDHPVGMVHTKNLLPEALRRQSIRVEEVMAPVLFIPDHTPVLKLLDIFKKERKHLAVVVDEYGTMVGIVTPTDILEAIAGNLPEQGDEADGSLVRREDGSWLVDGAFPIDEIEAKTGYTGLLMESGGVKTIAGFILEKLGRIPEPGARVRIGDLLLEVLDMDGRRIDKILLQRLPGSAGTERDDETGE